MKIPSSVLSQPEGENAIKSQYIPNSPYVQTIKFVVSGTLSRCVHHLTRLKTEAYLANYTIVRSSYVEQSDVNVQIYGNFMNYRPFLITATLLVNQSYNLHETKVIHCRTCHATIPALKSVCKYSHRSKPTKNPAKTQFCIPFVEAAILKWRQIFGQIRRSAETPEDDSTSLDLISNTHKRILIKSLFPFQSVYFRETFERFQSSNDGHLSVYLPIFASIISAQNRMRSNIGPFKTNPASKTHQKRRHIWPIIILPSFNTKLSLDWTTKVRENCITWPILTMVGTSVRMRQRHQCQGRPSSPNQSRQINSYNESNLNDFYTAMVSSHAREVLRYIRKGCTR